MVLHKLLTKGSTVDSPGRPAKSKDLDAQSTPSRAVKTVALSTVTPSNDTKRSRGQQASPSLTASPATGGKKGRQPSQSLASGNGSFQHPFRMSLRSNPNIDDCLHCAEDRCSCVWFAEQLKKVYAALSLKRITEIAKRRDMCAKSILPSFVARIVGILKLRPEQTFYDFGCGNGSVLFQVAFLTGVKCVGVELSEHNAELARQAWKLLKPILEKKAGRPMPHVEIVTGDLAEFAANDNFVKEPCAIWTANLLMPKSLTHYMSERFRKLPVGSQILCFDDLYPHSRSVAAIRDPEAFQLFSMVDYVWQEMSVEWTAAEGRFYYYRRTAAVAKPAEST